MTKSWLAAAASATACVYAPAQAGPESPEHHVVHGDLTWTSKPGIDSDMGWPGWRVACCRHSGPCARVTATLPEKQPRRSGPGQGRAGGQRALAAHLGEQQQAVAARQAHAAQAVDDAGARHLRAPRRARLRARPCARAPLRTAAGPPPRRAAARALLGWRLRHQASTRDIGARSTGLGAARARTGGRGGGRRRARAPGARW